MDRRDVSLQDRILYAHSQLNADTPVGLSEMKNHARIQDDLANSLELSSFSSRVGSVGARYRHL